MKLVDFVTSEQRFYGNVGERADFCDSNGDTLYVGDVVKIESSDELSVVVKEETDNKFHIMGLYGERDFVNGDWKVYKEKSYKSMECGNTIRHLKYVMERPKKKMTVSEICKELGYEVEIVKEEK